MTFLRKTVGPISFLLALFFANILIAQETVSLERLFAEVQGYLMPLTEPHNAQALEPMRKARRRLDRIVSEFPSSDMAVKILLQDTIDGVDVAKLNKEIVRLSALAPVDRNTNSDMPLVSESISPSSLSHGTAQTTPTQNSNELPVETSQESTLAISDMSQDSTQSDGAGVSSDSPPGNPSDDTVMDTGSNESDGQILQDPYSDLNEKERTLLAQKELARSGCNPGPVDGVLGEKTKRAFKNFVYYSGIDIEPNQPISSIALSTLNDARENYCTGTWLALNAPQKLAGRWSGIENCKFKSGNIKSRGFFNLIYMDGNKFQGDYVSHLRGAFGKTIKQRGTLSLTISGTKISGITRSGGTGVSWRGGLSDKSVSFWAADKYCKGTNWKSG